VELVLAPDSLDVVEDGATFEENAIKKAREAAELTGLIAIADDSGLEVDALGGRPGINSARYCDGTDADRRVKLLMELESVPADQRGAAFVCAMAVCVPTGEVLFTTTAKWHGQITFEERGNNGFGYDPLFLLPDRQKTSAEISPAEKNAISHRGQAFSRTLEFLKRITSGQPIVESKFGVQT
jgi:XTP/dITP diphosphohydrolase